MAATSYTDEQVLDILADNSEGLTAFQIALALDEDAEKDSTKIINPILYRLLREKKVHKTTPKKGAPVWTGISDEEKEQDNLLKSTLEAKLKTDKWTTTTKLAELCVIAGCPKTNLPRSAGQAAKTDLPRSAGQAAKTGIKTRVNAVLHAMLKAGTVEKEAEDDGTKPRWRKVE